MDPEQKLSERSPAARGSATLPLHVESEGVGGVRKFEAEGVTLYLADNRDVRDQLAADALISDPPYGMDWNTNSKRFSGGNRITDRGEGRDDWGDIAHDCEPFDPRPWLEYPRCVLWGANHYAARLPVGTTLVWLKKGDHLFGTFLSDAEIGWMKGGHGVYVFRKDWSPQTKANDLFGGGVPTSAHPSQKPIALMSWCMERAKVPPGALVCDPYTGSGSTAIACIRTGRRFVGAEKDERHFDTAVARIQRELSQPELCMGGGGGFSSEKPSGAATSQNETSSPTESA